MKAKELQDKINDARMILQYAEQVCQKPDCNHDELKDMFDSVSVITMNLSSRAFEIKTDALIAEIDGYKQEIPEIIKQIAESM